MPNIGTKKGTGPFSEDFVLVIGVIMCGLVGWLGVYAGNAKNTPHRALTHDSDRKNTNKI